MAVVNSNLQLPRSAASLMKTKGLSTAEFLCQCVWTCCLQSRDIFITAQFTSIQSASPSSQCFFLAKHTCTQRIQLEDNSLLNLSDRETGTKHVPIDQKCHCWHHLLSQFILYFFALSQRDWQTHLVERSLKSFWISLFPLSSPLRFKSIAHINHMKYSMLGCLFWLQSTVFYTDTVSCYSNLLASMAGKCTATLYHL